MSKRFGRLGLLALAAVVCLWSPPVSADEKPFSIVLLPDTQNYAAYFPETFFAQTAWVKANREKFNIRHVLHLGDLTEHDSTKEWQVADKAMGTLDGVVSYTVVPGNHDGSGRRRTKRYNRWFGPQRFKDKKHYGGHFGEGNESNVSFFDAGVMKFMVIGLEFGPRDEVLAWAGKLCEKHKDRRVIVVTHCYMYYDDTRVGRGDGSHPRVFLGSRPGNDGEQMWEKFVKHHENIFLVVSGHIRPRGTGRLTSVGKHGNKVHQLLANYQSFAKGGNGWLRLMKFVPAENKILVVTYSPTLNKFMNDDRHSFALKWTMTPAAKRASVK